MHVCVWVGDVGGGGGGGGGAAAGELVLGRTGYYPLGFRLWFDPSARAHLYLRGGQRRGWF